MPDEAKPKTVMGAHARPADSSAAEMNAIVRGEHSDPFQYLGPHREYAAGKNIVAVRVFQA